ncbi:MAG: D-sedoheptulose 7-phosphate isomerase [Chloroflexi bacterium]|nr:D-sedoheptulose 7-phosphate isomerase [Chloroflexota bacterium]
MKQKVIAELQESARLKQWVAANMSETIISAAEAIMKACRNGGKVLLCGNGGSAGDCQHLATEMVCRFEADRPPMCAIALTTDTSVLTAVANDLGFENVFARQVEALAAPGDILVAISTSGRSENVNRAVAMAKERGATTIGFTGGDGGRLASLVDIELNVPSRDVPRVQECHIAIGHVICGLLERGLFRG